MSRTKGCVIFEPPVEVVSSRRKPMEMSFWLSIAAPFRRASCAEPEDATATMLAPSVAISCLRLFVGASRPGVLPSGSVLTCVSVFTAAAFVARRVMYCANASPPPLHDGFRGMLSLVRPLDLEGLDLMHLKRVAPVVLDGAHVRRILP